MSLFLLSTCPNHFNLFSLSFSVTFELSLICLSFFFFFESSQKGKLREHSCLLPSGTVHTPSNIFIIATFKLFYLSYSMPNNRIHVSLLDSRQCNKPSVYPFNATHQPYLILPPSKLSSIPSFSCTTNS